jgi:hypothetical protein
MENTENELVVNLVSITGIEPDIARNLLEVPQENKVKCD